MTLKYATPELLQVHENIRHTHEGTHHVALFSDMWPLLYNFMDICISNIAFYEHIVGAEGWVPQTTRALGVVDLAPSEKDPRSVI